MRVAGRGVAALATAFVLAVGGDHARDPSVIFGVDVPRADLPAAMAFAALLDCRPTLLSVFVKLDSPSFTLSALQAIHAAGLTPLLTLEPWSYRSVGGQVNQPDYSLAAIAAGRHDAQLIQIADVIAAFGHPVYLRFAHEMNGTWYPWAQGVNGNLAAQYIEAWRHVHAVINSLAARRQIRWVWSPVIGSLTHNTVPLRDLYPGDAWVDDVGVSGYIRAAGPDDTAANTYGPTLDKISAFTSKPALLTEVGADGAHRAHWLQSLGQYLRDAPTVIGLVYYNTTSATTGATGNYAITAAQPADLEAMRAALRTARAPGSVTSSER